MLLTFLNGKYFPVHRLDVTSKKSDLMGFVSTVIGRFSFLNIEIISFLILSSTGFLPLLTVRRPSSLYRPNYSFPNNGDKFSRRLIPTLLHISAPWKLPTVTSNDQLSPPFTQVFKPIDLWCILVWPSGEIYIYIYRERERERERER